MAITCFDSVITDRYSLYHGDCIKVMAGIPSESIGMSVFSPPFADLYSYSDSPNDLGNCGSYAEFFGHFKFVSDELFRIIQSGRIVAVHCIDIPAMKERDGYIGLKDFPGDIIRLFQKSGFIYHSRHCIWKDPLTEATRTKALGLMHKQLCKDSTKSRSGLPDYLLAFRKPGDNAVPVEHPDGLTSYAGEHHPGGDGIKASHNIWRAYASPVWMDIRQSLTLNKTAAREEKDQKHICPLQLDVIERAITLWSTTDDIIFTPFGGIGSEAHVAIKMGRKAVLAELKDGYYRQAIKNCAAAVAANAPQSTLF